MGPERSSKIINKRERGSGRALKIINTKMMRRIRKGGTEGSSEPLIKKVRPQIFNQTRPIWHIQAAYILPKTTERGSFLLNREQVA